MRCVNVDNLEQLSKLYCESLMVMQGQISCTALSEMYNRFISHDKLTRFLSSGYVDEKYVWKKAKALCEEIRAEGAVLIVDDTIEEKPYMDENELICWHYDHSLKRHVKGVCMLTALYHSWQMSVPVGVEFVTKPMIVKNKEGKQVRRSVIGKNELFRRLVGHAIQNISFDYVIADSWYGNSGNMDFVNRHGEKFIFALKSNKKVALSYEDKKRGSYVRISSLKLEGRTLVAWVEQLDFPILVTCQVFKDGNDTGTLYLASNDLNLSYEQMTTIYQKRWKVEEYHRSIKSNSNFSRSPARRVVSQKSHFILAICAFNMFELMRIRSGKSHFWWKEHLRVIALKEAHKKLQELLTPHIKKTA